MDDAGDDGDDGGASGFSADQVTAGTSSATYAAIELTEADIVAFLGG